MVISTQHRKKEGGADNVKVKHTSRKTEDFLIPMIFNHTDIDDDIVLVNIHFSHSVKGWEIEKCVEIVRAWYWKGAQGQFGGAFVFLSDISANGDALRCWVKVRCAYVGGGR